MRVLPGLAVAAALLGASPALRALEQHIDDAALSEALALARRGGPALDAFHRPYVTIVGDPTYDRIEIIGEFRRAVMMAEERQPVDSNWDVAASRAAMAPFRGTVSVVLWMRFPPQNVLISAPDYGLIVYPEGAGPLGAPDDGRPVLRPVSQSVTPLYLAGGGTSLTGPPGSAMSGLRIETMFDTTSLPAAGVVTVGIVLEGTEQRRVDVSLTGLR